MAFFHVEKRGRFYGSSRFFNSVAKNWDNMIEVNDSKINYLLSKLEIKEDDSILDIGTGTGVLIPFLDNLVPSVFIRGIDISKGMLEVALEKYGNKSNIAFDLVDVENDEMHYVVIHKK